MNHLPIPESSKARAMPVPYLGIAPRYDRKGFNGFPERHGIRVNDLISQTLGSSTHVSPAHKTGVLSPMFVESFLQEWLWFGALHEFELACGVKMNPGTFIQLGLTRPYRVLNTEALLTYVRAVIIKKLVEEGVSLDLEVGEYVHVRHEGLKYGPFRISEILGKMRYKIETDPPQTVSAAILRRFTENADTQTPTTFPQNQYPNTPLKVLTRLLIAIHPPKETRYRHNESQSPVAKCLKEVRRLTRLALSEEKSVLRLEIALSIDILCESLSEALRVILREETNLDTHSVFYLDCFGEKMKAENWCAARTEWESTFGIEIQYILSLLPSHSSVAHPSCGTVACSYNPQALDSLNAKHRLEDCNGDCQEISFDEASLIKILRDGGNPGILEKQDPQHEAGYMIVDTKGKQYIAISHVWSHGLGNPLRNALPSCQIRHLFSLIKRIEPSDLILWIDTISVPIQPEYKQLAISKLRDVYRQAYKVLVLDRHLLQVGSHWLEQRLQLMCSEWIRRLWTLQEGKLASNLYIQFANQATPMTELAQTQPQDDLEFDPDIFNGIYLKTGLDIDGHFTTPDNFGERFIRLATDLAHRSATVPSDEPICVATMLGLELEKLDPFPPTMQDIYLSFRELPQELMFVRSEKLQVPGLRWAPSTFLEAGVTAFVDRQTLGLLCKDGLKVRKDCLYFKEGLDFRHNSESLPEMYCVGSNDSCEFAFKAYDEVLNQTRNFKAAAIILHKDGDVFSSTSRGILVSLIKETDGVTHSHFEGCVDVWRVNESTTQDIDNMLRQPHRKANYYVTGTFGAQQSFYVD